MSSPKPLTRTTAPILPSGEKENVRSPGVFGPLLLPGFGFCPGSRRQLQHGCRLAFLEIGQQNLMTVRHFQDIMMDAWLVLVPLPKDRGGEPFKALYLRLRRTAWWG